MTTATITAMGTTTPTPTKFTLTDGIPNPAAFFLEAHMRKFFTFAFLFTVAVAAFAQGAPASTGSFNTLFDTTKLIYIAVAGAAAACGTAQAKVLSSAYEAMARNPQAADKISGSLVLGLAFIEALVLFTFALAFIVK